MIERLSHQMFKYMVTTQFGNEDDMEPVILPPRYFIAPDINYVKKHLLFFPCTQLENLTEYDVFGIALNTNVANKFRPQKCGETEEDYAFSMMRQLTVKDYAEIYDYWVNNRHHHIHDGIILETIHPYTDPDFVIL